MITNQLAQFLILLVVALIANAIPMDEALRKIINIVFGVVVLLMVLKFVHFI